MYKRFLVNILLCQWHFESSIQQQVLKAKTKRMCFVIKDREWFSEDRQLEQVTQLLLFTPVILLAMLRTHANRVLFLTDRFPYQVTMSKLKERMLSTRQQYKGHSCWLQNSVASSTSTWVKFRSHNEESILYSRRRATKAMSSANFTRVSKALVDITSLVYGFFFSAGPN